MSDKNKALNKAYLIYKIFFLVCFKFVLFLLYVFWGFFKIVISNDGSVY